MSQRWRVTLPAHVGEPFEVYVNGVAQREGADYERRGRVLFFDRPLQQEGRLGLGRWMLGAIGIGTYRQNDSVDVRYEAGGQSRLAQGLAIEAPEPGPGPGA